jgi:hypothetical protein
MRRLAIGCVTAFVLVAAGCSAGEKILPKEDVEAGAKEALTKSVGQEPDSVSCPDDLDAKVGASERCTLTSGGDTLGMTVTVKSVDGDNATYEVEVDQ